MKHVTTTEELRSVAAHASYLMIVHAQAGWIEPLREDRFDFFTRLYPLLEAQGVACAAVDFGSPLSEGLLEQAHIHLILGDAPLYAPGVLHVAPAYLWGFWYLDELGINANSSIRLKDFHAETVDRDHAEWFFNGVSSWNLENNVSRSPQAPRAEGALEPAQSVVFCQGIEHRRPRQHYLTTAEMIRNAARAAGGGIVYVKAHPAASETEKQALEAMTARDPNLRLSEASVHDLIAASGWVVTQNSAAGFEAFLQRKPVITCGVSDFHHMAQVARTEEALRALLREPPPQAEWFDHPCYLSWFLEQNCLEPGADSFAERAWARIAEKCMM